MVSLREKVAYQVSHEHRMLPPWLQYYYPNVEINSFKRNIYQRTRLEANEQGLHRGRNRPPDASI